MARVRTLLPLVLGSTVLQATSLIVPNASFESPVVPEDSATQVDTRIDSWQETPKPPWYDEGGGFLWDQLTGVFRNQPAPDERHLENCDGAQAMYLFAVPEVGLFQDYDSVDWSTATPTHAFDARFEVGRAYDLTVGVIGGGGNMIDSVTLEISLFYRDDAGNPVTVASTTVAHDPALFGTRNQFVDFTVHLPTVQAEDAWAGRHIGVKMLSTVDPALVGGFWDLDHVRLSEIREPALRDPSLAVDQFTFTLESEPGMVFDIVAADNLALPAADWARVGTVTNGTGSVSLSYNTADLPWRFYRARQLP